MSNKGQLFARRRIPVRLSPFGCWNRDEFLRSDDLVVPVLVLPDTEDSFGWIPPAPESSAAVFKRKPGFVAPGTTFHCPRSHRRPSALAFAGLSPTQLWHVLQSAIQNSSSSRSGPSLPRVW